MRKNLLLYLLLELCLFSSLYGQDSLNSVPPRSLKVGYYQTIDLSSNTPCACDAKTPRTRELNKALAPKDVLEYQLHAYKFSFLDTPAPVAKLFKAIEGDQTVYKISMKEWDSFVLLTHRNFDTASFEEACKLVFATFEVIDPAQYLLSKNQEAYQEYKQNRQ